MSRARNREVTVAVPGGVPDGFEAALSDEGIPDPYADLDEFFPGDADKARDLDNLIARLHRDGHPALARSMRQRLDERVRQYRRDAAEIRRLVGPTETPAEDSDAAEVARLSAEARGDSPASGAGES